MTEQRLAVGFQSPEIPPDLAKALRIRAYRMDSAIPLAPEYNASAEGVLAAYIKQLQATTLPMVRGWLEDLALGVPKPQSRQNEGMDRIALAVFMACRELPSACWTQATLVHALRTFKWFPVPAEVYELLKPEADKIADTIAGLKAIANAPRAMVAREPAQPYQPPPPPEWVGDRTIRGARGRPVLNIHPPLRSVEEQIALLKAG